MIIGLLALGIVQGMLCFAAYRYGQYVAFCRVADAFLLANREDVLDQVMDFAEKNQ